MNQLNHRGVNRKNYFRKFLSGGGGGNSSQKEKSSNLDDIASKETLISKSKSNFNSVLRFREPEIREKFKGFACAIIEMSLPFEFRNQAHLEGLWLQSKVTGDKTEESALTLIPSNNVIHGSIGNSAVTSVISRNTDSTPSSVIPTAGYDKSYAELEHDKLIKEAADSLADAGSDLKKNRKKLTGLQQDFVNSSNSPAVINARPGSFVAKQAALDAIRFKAKEDLVQKNIEHLNELIALRMKALENARVDLKRYLTASLVEKEKAYRAYKSVCAQMIGYVQGLCDDNLKHDLNTNASYLQAVKKDDIVQVCYIIRTIVMDADTENVMRRRQQRLVQLINMSLNDKDDFQSFADSYLNRYRELADISENNIVSTESENLLVMELGNKVGNRFKTITEAWALNSKGERPSNIVDAMQQLKLFYQRVEVSKLTSNSTEPPAKKQKVSLDDEIKTTTAYLTTLKKQQERGGRGEGGRTGRGGRGGRGSGRDDTKGSNQRGDNLCKWFAENGSCRFGNNCKFSHDTSNSNHRSTNNNNSNQSSKEVQLCKSIMETGECNNPECPRKPQHNASYQAICAKHFNNKGNELDVSRIR